MERKLYRSENKMIAGVCSGLGEFFDIDPTIVRLAWAAMIVLFGSGLIVYLIAWLIIPRRVL